MLSKQFIRDYMNADFQNLSTEAQRALIQDFERERQMHKDLGKKNAAEEQSLKEEAKIAGLVRLR